MLFEVVTIAAISLVGAIANRLRGSITGGDILYSACFAAIVYLFTADKLISGLCFISMWAAMAGAWGVILGAIGGINGNWFEGTYKAHPWILWLCRPLEGNTRLWGVSAGLLRGLYFCLPLGLVNLYLAIAAPFLFVGGYFIGISLEQIFRGRNGFEWGEYAVGFIHFLTVGLLFISLL